MFSVLLLVLSKSFSFTENLQALSIWILICYASYYHPSLPWTTSGNFPSDSKTKKSRLSVTNLGSLNVMITLSKVPPALALHLEKTHCLSLMPAFALGHWQRHQEAVPVLLLRHHVKLCFWSAVLHCGVSCALPLPLKLYLPFYSPFKCYLGSRFHH